MKIKRNKKGFTLIEVVLVLAIGGLIFLLAFLAFQQVSTNRRDTQRRNDAARLVAEVENYYGDKGAYPIADGTVPATSFAGFLSTYMGGTNFKDPSSTVYSELAAATSPTSTQIGKIQYVTGSGCGTTTAAFKIEVAIEKGGSVCRDPAGN